MQRHDSVEREQYLAGEPRDGGYSEATRETGMRSLSNREWSSNNRKSEQSERKQGCGKDWDVERSILGECPLRCAMPPVSAWKGNQAAEPPCSAANKQQCSCDRRRDALPSTVHSIVAPWADTPLDQSGTSLWSGNKQSPLSEHEDANDSRWHIKNKKNLRSPSPHPKLEIYLYKRQWGWSSGDSEIQMTQRNDRIEDCIMMQSLVGYYYFQRTSVSLVHKMDRRSLSHFVLPAVFNVWSSMYHIVCYSGLFLKPLVSS